MDSVGGTTYGGTGVYGAQIGGVWDALLGEEEARQLFKASRGRDPNADELAALRRNWLDNEVLYREGLALQVDRGDTAIRERVIFKALSAVDANVRRPPATE